MSAEDFDKWLDGVPVVEVGSEDFDVWLDGVPVLQPGSETEPELEPERRRVGVGFIG